MRVLPMLLFSLLATAAVTAERAPSLDEILARHAVAAGPGLDSVEVGLRIEEPEFTVTATYVASRDGRMRIDVYDGDTRVFTEALDGEGGWQWATGFDKPAPLSADGRAALERGVVANLHTLAERPALGYRLELVGGVKLDGRQHWRVSSVAPDGFEEILYIDTVTWLVAASEETSALHPDIDPERRLATTRYADFRSAAGRTRPWRIETRDVATGERVQQTTVTRFVANPPLPAGTFAANLP